MSRPKLRLLRDAALGYASRGIPVLPLHYPLPHHRDLQALTGDQQLPSPVVRTSCSCRDPHCGQVGKHPLGHLVPHGVKDATTNRARILAWWARHPQANIGLATGHRFDVLDVDGPTGTQAIQELAATHGLQSCGPLVRTGGDGWHYYLHPTGLGNAHPRDLEHVDWRGRGGYVVAPPSRHASGHPYQWVPGRDLDTHPARCPQCCWSGSNPINVSDQPVRSRSRPSPAAQVIAMRGRPWPRNWLGSPLPPSATAIASCGSRPATSTTWSPPAPSTSARSTEGCWRPPNAAGCSLTSRGRPAAPWPRAARSASPTPATYPPRTHRCLAAVAAGGPRGRQGEGVMAMDGAGQPAG